MIRRAVARDVPWIARVSSEVYAPLGDYGSLVPEWVNHPGVMTYVEESMTPDGPVARGFILLGFYHPPGPAQRTIADLLAIAVDPAHQRQRVGKALLDFAIQMARLASRAERVREIQLTVADTNHVGWHLFTSSGFEVLDHNHGNYDGGQRAIRMTRALA